MQILTNFQETSNGCGILSSFYFIDISFILTKGETHFSCRNFPLIPQKPKSISKKILCNNAILFHFYSIIRYICIDRLHITLYIKDNNAYKAILINKTA